MTERRILFEGLEERVLLDAVTAVDGPYEARSPAAEGTYLQVGSVGTFDVPTFDDHDGARTLQRVIIEVTITMHDGQYVFDNEDDAPATVTLTMSAEANNFTYAGGVIDGLTVTATEAGTSTVTGDESEADEPGDPNMPPPPFTPPNFTGPDSFALVGKLATDPDAETDADNDTLSLLAGDNLDAFLSRISGDTVDIDYSSTSGYSIQGDDLLGQEVPLPPPSFFCSATVTYEYTLEPVLEITKGIVATNGGGSFTRSVGPAGLSWTPPTTVDAGPRWTGGDITSPGLAVRPIDSDLTNAKQGELVTYAVVIQNLGGDIDGAYNVQFYDTIPDGMAIPDSATWPTGLNLRIFDGAGDELVLNAPGGYTLLGNGLFDPAGGIELTDPGPTGTPGGALDYYDPAAPDTGRNLIVMTYDMVIEDSVAGQTFTNVATVYHASHMEDPTGQSPAELENVLSTPLSDPASVSGYSYVYDWYDRWDGGVIEELPPAALTYAPMYSGTGEPGSTLNVSLYDPQGNLIGSETTVVDAGGNWMTSFFKTVMRDDPHSVVVRQTYGGGGALAEAGYNLRTYFSPAIQGGTFVSEHLTVENVLGNRGAANAVDALHVAGYYPILLGWQAYSFEFLAAPGSPSGI